MTERLGLFCKWLSRVVMALASACLVAITAIISWQVCARYVLNNSPAWTEQAALLALVWMIFLGGAAGVHQGFHLRLSLLENSSPEPWRRWLRVGTQALVVLFGLTMAVCGAGLGMATMDHELPALGVSRAVTYMPVALSGALIAVFALDRAIAIAQGREATAWN